MIGSIRREFLDHVIVLHETGLCRVLKLYFEYVEPTAPYVLSSESSAMSLWRCCSVSMRRALNFLTGSIICSGVT